MQGQNKNEILNSFLVQRKDYYSFIYFTNLNSTVGDLKIAATRPLKGTPGPVTLSTVEVKEARQIEPFQ